MPILNSGIIGGGGGNEEMGYFATQGPCEYGFHVPTKDEWVAVKNIRTALGGGSSDGTNFGKALKLPFAGGRSNRNSNVVNQGTNGLYWSSTRGNENEAYSLYFNTSRISYQYNYPRSNGFSIRPFKNVPVAPDSNWIVTYQGTGSAGIYHNPILGLISISSDGSNWITIADKNLGATQISNTGDGFNEKHCGKYYQWGNNYGFPYSGTVTTSSTQVDASTYGPGNYYNSSTFITRSSSPYRWDSTDNANLWGGVDGNVPIDEIIQLKSYSQITSMTIDNALIDLNKYPDIYYSKFVTEGHVDTSNAAKYLDYTFTGTYKFAEYNYSTRRGTNTKVSGGAIL